MHKCKVSKNFRDFGHPLQRKLLTWAKIALNRVKFWLRTKKSLIIFDGFDERQIVFY